MIRINMAVPTSLCQTPQEILQQLQRVISQSNQQALPSQRVGNPVITTVVGGQGLEASCGSGPRPVRVQVNNTTGPAVLVSKPREPNPVFSYKVRIINPAKKSDVIVRQLNGFSSKFASVNALRLQLIESFSDQVPNTVTFNVGYYDGSQQAKVWLFATDDLQTMYQKYKGGQISLWCDGRLASENSEERGPKRKKDSESSTRRQEKEENVESVYKELLEKHGKKFDTPKLRLWSRMICSDLHDDYDNPPDIPAFSSVTPKRPRKESLSDAITGAAVAFAQVLQPDNKKTVTEQPTVIATAVPSTGAGISPGKCIDLRMKNFEQLRYLQGLFEDGILCQEEFVEQKRNILSSLSKLS